MDTGGVRRKEGTVQVVTEEIAVHEYITQEPVMIDLGATSISEAAIIEYVVDVSEEQVETQL